ncbi:MULTISPECIES: hypothetical protein [Methylobacterium]|uniref:Uncharacterized protein n=1 Tax=Methylobacterium ajmalii TaxID=2738439 RepID=A0ABV0A2J0_9HYPH|nr:hypothetical protein [Methylobacterium aquaticum]
MQQHLDAILKDPATYDLAWAFQTRMQDAQPTPDLRGRPEQATATNNDASASCGYWQPSAR